MERFDISLMTFSKYSSAQHHSVKAPKRQTLGSTSIAPQAAYRALFCEQLPPPLVEVISKAALSGLTLGNDKFRQQIQQLTGQSVQPSKPGRPTQQGQIAKPDNNQRLL